MLPAIVLVQAQMNLHEWPPLRTFGLADEVDACLLRSAIGLLRVTSDARADDVFPGRRAAPITRDHVIEIEFAAIEDLPAILAGILIPLKNVMPGKLNFFLGKPVKNHE